MSENSTSGIFPLQLSDEELMERYRTNGDEGAFATLYDRHARRVYGYLTQRIPKREECDEVHQCVFLKFHRSRHLYDSRHSVLQWLFVIARTTLMDHFRKVQRSVLTVDDPDGLQSAKAVVPEQLERSVEFDALKLLSERERSAIHMRVLDELSYHEIARRLGHSEPSVRQMVSRALKKLRLSLASKGIIQ